MKIRNLIHGTAVVCLVSVFWSNPALCRDCNVICTEGTLKCDVACNCSCDKGFTEPSGDYSMMNTENLYMNNDFQGGEYTGGVVIDKGDPKEATEVCGTKEVGGDITYCCHMSSGLSSSTYVDHAKDLINSMQNTNILDKVPATSAVDALGNFTN